MSEFIKGAPPLKCQCGGHIGMAADMSNLRHSFPACSAYMRLNIDELLKTRGALANALWELTNAAKA